MKPILKKVFALGVPLLLSSCMVLNYVNASCGLPAYPLDWYAKRTIQLNPNTLGMKPGASPQEISSWIRAHPGCCAVRPVENDPLKRALLGSDIVAQIAYERSTNEQPYPYAALLYTYNTCGSYADERTGQRDLQKLPDKFLDISGVNGDVKDWRIEE